MTHTDAHAPALPYRPDIDGLRAVAVTIVIIYHFGLGLLPGGFVGVDVFFVISGFLITSIIARESDENRFSFLTFYERRIRRIFPALILVLVVTSLAAWVILLPEDFSPFGRVLAWTPLFGSNFVLMNRGDYFEPASGTKPLLHTWSLGVEEQFYIVFPWLLIAARRFRVSRTGLVAGISALSLATSIVSALVGWDKSFFLLSSRFWELGAGSLVALSQPKFTNTPRHWLATIGLGAIILSCFALNPTMGVPGWVVLPAVLGAVGVILGAGGLASRLLATTPFVALGRISYPMYLWHWPLIVFVMYVSSRPLGAASAVIIFAATILLSYATLVFIEVPIRSRVWFKERGSLFLAATVSSIPIIALGITAIATRGLPSRWSDAELALIEQRTRDPEIMRTCGFRNRGEMNEAPPCAIGSISSKHYSFALIGDSHSQQIAHAVSMIAEKVGARGIFMGAQGCPPLENLDSDWQRRDFCSLHLGKTLQSINQFEVDTVFLVARWAAYISSSPAQDRRWDWLLLRTSRPAEERAASAARKDAFARFANRRVVVLFSTPEMGAIVPNALALTMRFGVEMPVMRQDAYDERQKHVREFFAEVVAENANVEVLEPASILCATGICQSTLNGNALYSDTNHLTESGARLIAPLFEPALKRAATEAKMTATR